MNNDRRVRLSLLLSAALVLWVQPARAEMVLASGAAWPGAGHAARPVASIAWRHDLGRGWSGDGRWAGSLTALSLRRDIVLRGALRSVRPGIAAGVLGVVRDGAPTPRVAGFHVETGIAYPLPEGAALELTARWVVRGDDGRRGPDAFAGRYGELTLGVAFAPR